MNLSSKLITAAAMTTAAVLFSMPTYAEIVPKQILDKIYGRHDRKQDCWFTMNAENNQRYCLKIDRIDKVEAETGSRLYILVAGNAVDEKGEDNGAHVSSGLVGAFVLEERNGQAVIIAAEPKHEIGASGFAPTQWKLVKLGPSDYWGWQNEAGDCHQGYCGSRYAILAPYGKKIRDISGITAYVDDSGGFLNKRRPSSIESKLEIDSTQINEKVFPLLITVVGKKKGKKLTPKTWVIPFDSKKWTYPEPKGWPLAGVEF